MIRLLDGPAEGTYAVRAAPTWLRAVVIHGSADVLDQPNDKPEPGERVYVYRIVEGTRGTVHLHFSGSARRQSGFYALGDYHWQPEVDGEALRDREAWVRWAHSQPGSPPHPGATEGGQASR